MDTNTVQLINAIGSMYDSAIDPDHWETFIHKIGDIMNGLTGVLILNPDGTPAQHLRHLEHKGTYTDENQGVVAKYTNFPADLMQHYMDHFFLENDVWHQEICKRRLNNEVFLGTDLVPLEELRETRFYKEVFNAVGNEYIIGAVVEPTPTGVTSFTMCREKEKGKLHSGRSRDLRAFGPSPAKSKNNL